MAKDFRALAPLQVVSCEGCDESWTWEMSDRLQATFAEWYSYLDELLLMHLVQNPLCWANLTRSSALRELP